MVIGCGNKGGTWVPVKGTSLLNYEENDFSFSTPLDALLGSDRFEMKAKLGLEVDFDLNGSIFNVYDVWNEMHGAASSAYDGIRGATSDAYNRVSGYLGFDDTVQAPSPASGGFVLYPNRPNTNMMQMVYSK
jgi:hypothetical protein